MPIKQAGPFADSSDSFLDEPISPTLAILPVNCAKDNQSFWPWKAVIVEYSGTDIDPVFAPEISVGSVDLSEEITALEEDTLILKVNFAYQAMQSWSFSGTEYGVTIDSTLGQSLVIKVNDSVVYSDSVTDEPFEDSTFDTVIFPASTTPLRVEITMEIVTPQQGAIGTLKIPI